MANGAILPILPPSLNASWQLQFLGPSVECQPMNSSMHLQVRQNLFSYLSAPASKLGMSNTYYLHEYLDWFPSGGLGPDGTPAPDLPFVKESANGTLAFKEMLPGYFNEKLNLFVASHAMVEKYEMAMREDNEAESAWITDLAHASPAKPPDWLDGTMLTCQFFNSTYDVSFDYTNGVQHIDVQTSLMNAINSSSMLGTVIGPSPQEYIRNSTCVLLAIDWTANADMNDAPSECSFDTEILRILSYQAIWDAFTRVLQGMILGNYESEDYQKPNIINTALLNTPELAFLRNTRGAKQLATLQDLLARYDNPAIKGLTNSHDEVIQLPLATALEEMFRNITVSLMSSPALQ